MKQALSSQENAFLEALRLSARKRVSLFDIRKAYFELNPLDLNAPDRQALLLAALRRLEEVGAVRLPVFDGVCWEKTGSPPLPLWIQLAQAEKKAAAVDPSAVAWAPELGFWPELKPVQLADAVAVNEFLLRRRGPLLSVPVKERSLEIFGDEKRLDTLRTGDTLFRGRLSLATLGAFVVPLPLPYRAAAAPGKPVLVLENHNSFFSWGEWNARNRRYSAVVYGAGAAFFSSGQSLAQVLREVDGRGARYLGDLDVKGVNIPLDYNRSPGAQQAQVAPEPALYRWLLENGQRREKIECKAGTVELAQSWLQDAELASGLAEVWSSGQWIPQESLGLEQLLDYPEADLFAL